MGCGSSVNVSVNVDIEVNGVKGSNTKTAPATGAQATGASTGGPVAVATKEVIIILECAGGEDKDAETGHRKDSVALRQAFDGLSGGNVTVQLLHYKDSDAEALVQQLSEASVLLPRIAPGQYEGATWSALQAFTTRISAASSRCRVMPPPTVSAQLLDKGAWSLSLVSSSSSLAVAGSQVVDQASLQSSLSASLLQHGSLVLRPASRSPAAEHTPCSKAIWVTHSNSTPGSLALGSLQWENLGTGSAATGTLEDLLQACRQVYSAVGRGQAGASDAATASDSGNDAVTVLLQPALPLPKGSGELCLTLSGTQLLAAHCITPAQGKRSPSPLLGASYASSKVDSPHVQEAHKSILASLPQLLSALGAKDESELPPLWSALLRPVAVAAAAAGGPVAVAEAWESATASSSFTSTSRAAAAVVESSEPGTSAGDDLAGVVAGDVAADALAEAAGDALHDAAERAAEGVPSPSSLPSAGATGTGTGAAAAGGKLFKGPMGLKVKTIGGKDSAQAAVAAAAAVIEYRLVDVNASCAACPKGAAEAVAHVIMASMGVTAVTKTKTFAAVCLL